ncbi:MAG: glycogen/starch/alpha-glucan phosphorylase [Candidatus Eisenbacteria sp.]|nr:glycogen/starch/alpha-glucan phosphorylase [Candidatus Eisenbacteria bacterium]
MSLVQRQGDSPADSVDPQELKGDILRHIQKTLGNDTHKPDKFNCYMGLAHCVRERLLDRWIESQHALYDTFAKRVYFLSLEFLPGRFMHNYLISLGMEDAAREAVSELGFDLEELECEEMDPGLGNGGLGRLASCYLDSMACLGVPGYGYGIRYDYGMFHQSLEDGHQREQCDNWARNGSPWDVRRPKLSFPVRFFGHTETYEDSEGCQRCRWVEGQTVMAMANDILIPGYGNTFVSNMRLWVAQSSSEFDLQDFNQGDYIGAVQAKVLSENISKVLYPNDENTSGRELRLKQQYFLVAATLADILRRFKQQSGKPADIPDYVAIQLNDTHPTIAVPELMRILMDDEALGWDEAWSICCRTFAYTNHTVLPEALEKWPVELIGRLLPRHLEIIYEINRRFLDEVRLKYPDQPELLEKVSLIQEGPVRMVRMAHLAIVGSHTVNGVAELHSRILKDDLFSDFERVFPGRVQNVTNGITPRRWLYQANPLLSALITSRIGPDWVRHLDQLARLVPLAEDPKFRREWQQAKHGNKQRLARYTLRRTGIGVDPHTMFDVQVKRIHEYKRQLLNVLHVITLYNRLCDPNGPHVVPRTVIFAGKAAPAYHQAKLIIKLINSVAAKVNTDPASRGKLRVVFLPNYCVSQAEKIVTAADLSEQVSTAGFEASGTGNMKMSLNGALTIGTLDGANIEIMEEVGRENIFIFGLTAEEVAQRRRDGHNPRAYYEDNAELRRTLDMIGSGYFSPENPRLFAPIMDALLDSGDYYLLLADYADYMATQDEVGRAFEDPDRWTRMSILNTAHMGKFSSDRSIMEYADRIWRVNPLDG